MANSAAFDWICAEIEERTSLNRLEARGTVRLTLREAGLESGSVRAEQLAVVLEKLLSGQLASRGIDGSDDLCRELARCILEVELDGDRSEAPEDVFHRLGGGDG
jgi:hypothetical protein